MPSEKSFETSMASYREVIDSKLANISTGLVRETADNYGEHAVLPVEAFCSLLARGGKRIRGALLINGYEMCGGQDEEMILKAACAVEMMHAYILAIDDIQDRSDLRRGGLSVHRILEDKILEKKWRGNHSHNSISLAINGALIGNHYALNILGSLDVSYEIRDKVLELMNTTMIVTAHGQTGDIINEINGEVTAEDVDAVVLHKTARYTILNPLQIGMVLAGCKDEELEVVSPYAMALGRAFQITDDALTYSNNPLDKDPAIDIRDGKITLIMLYALKNTSSEKRQVLTSLLGKSDLSEEEFRRCVKIVKSSGAVDKAIESARTSSEAAVASTYKFPKSWDKDNVSFMRDLARYVINRNG